MLLAQVQPVKLCLIYDWLKLNKLHADTLIKVDARHTINVILFSYLWSTSHILNSIFSVYLSVCLSFYIYRSIFKDSNVFYWHVLSYTSLFLICSILFASVRQSDVFLLKGGLTIKCNNIHCYISRYTQSLATSWRVSSAAISSASPSKCSQEGIEIFTDWTFKVSLAFCTTYFQSWLATDSYHRRTG